MKKLMMQVINDNNHIINTQYEFLEYLKGLTYKLNGDRTPDKINFEVRTKNLLQSLVIIDNDVMWLKSEELAEWIKAFNYIKVSAIDKIQFGYIVGLVSPFSSTKDKIDNYYVVWVKLTYKNS